MGIADFEKMSSFIDSLPRAQARDVTNEIVVACKIDRRKFYNWKYGKARIEPLYKDKIIEVIGKNIFQ